MSSISVLFLCESGSKNNVEENVSLYLLYSNSLAAYIQDRNFYDGIIFK